MIFKMAGKKCRVQLKSLILAGLGLAFCVSAWPAAAQQNQPDQPSEVQAPAGQPDSQEQGQPDSPEHQQPGAQPQDQSVPQVQGQANQAVLPETLTLAAGTVIRVRTDEWISSDRNLAGDTFSAVLYEPIVVNGWVVARRGQAQTGRLSVVKKGHGGGTSQLGVDLPELTLVDGQQLPLQTELYQTSAGASRGRFTRAGCGCCRFDDWRGRSDWGHRSWRDRRCHRRRNRRNCGNHRRLVYARQTDRDSSGNSPFLPVTGARDHLDGE